MNSWHFRSALTSLVMIAGVLPLMAQGGTRFHLPSNTGMTEDQILSLIVPDHDASKAVWEKKKGIPDDFFDEYVAGIDRVEESDLGFAGRHFLIASVYGHHALCNSCYFWAFGIIDLESKKLVESSSGEGVADDLRIFRLFPEDKYLSIALHYSAGPMGHRDHGEGYEEVWRSSKTANGVVAVSRVWLGLSYSWEGDPDAYGIGGCGRLEPGTHAGEYVYTFHFFDGHAGTKEGGDEGNQPGRCADDFGAVRHAVDIVRTQILLWKGDHFDAQPPILSRIDLHPATEFPFRLPVSRSQWSRSKQNTHVGGQTDDGPYIYSPDLKFRALVRAQDEEKFLSIEPGKGGPPLRRIPLGQLQESTVGWSADSSRVLFTTNLPTGEVREIWILTSFGVSNTEDYWESVLGETEHSVAQSLSGFEDGFVMSETARRPERK